MMIYGYARVSTVEQNLNMQIDALTQYGVEKIFKEKLTGTRNGRPQLEELLKVFRSKSSDGLHKQPSDKTY